jgi:hypothetical protein
VGDDNLAVWVTRLEGEVNSLKKDVEKLEDGQKICLDFQKQTDRKLSHSVSEIGLTRMEVKTRMDAIEAFVNEHKKDHGESHKTAQAKQWALWMVLITTGVSSIAGLIIKIVMG